MHQKIIAVERMFHGHLKLTLEDGNVVVLHRGTHLPRGPHGGAHPDDPKAGDVWASDVAKESVAAAEPANTAQTGSIVIEPNSHPADGGPQQVAIDPAPAPPAAPAGTEPAPAAAPEPAKD